MKDGPSGGTSPGGDRVRDVVSYYRAVAPVIDREPADSDELSFWRREVERADPRRVMDLGCGTGRITAALATGSRRVLGLDLSPHMLRRARRRLAGEGPVALVRGDVRRLPVAPGWDMIAAADGLFGHLLNDDERQAALEEIVRALAPSGRFVLEGLWLPRPVFRAASREGWSRRRRLDRPVPGALEEVRERWRCDEDTRICRARFEYGPGDGSARLSAAFRARIWDEGEVVERFRSAGLRIRGKWGDFHRSEFSPRESRRLIVAADRG